MITMFLARWIPAALVAACAFGKSPFDSLERVTGKVISEGRLTQAELEAAKEIRASIARLTELYQRASGSGIPESYSRTMCADVEALRAVLDSAPERAAVLEDVRKDLRLKLKVAEGGLGFAGGFPAVVKVTVDTVREGKKAHGLYVRCNPLRYGVTATPLFVFNSASTPTAAELPPGLFMIWVESADKKVLASQPMEIGASGSDSEFIRFALP